MNARRSRFWLIPLLVLFCLLVQPASVESQCMYATPSNYVGTGPGFITVLKYLASSATCTLVLPINANSCNPAGPSLTMSLFASALTASTMTMSVSCSWNCGCGTVTVDGSDGLPVELMDFEISDLETEGAGTFASSR